MLIFLAEESGKVIRSVESSGDNRKSITKVDSSPVTVADLRVQKTIETCLQALYPSLNIQGEESAESLLNVEPTVKASDITNEIKNFIKTDFLNSF